MTNDSANTSTTYTAQQYQKLIHSARLGQPQQPSEIQVKGSTMQQSTKGREDMLQQAGEWHLLSEGNISAGRTAASSWASTPPCSASLMFLSVGLTKACTQHRV